MAEQVAGVRCGFFDAVNSDRTYSANDMNKPYARLVADGVFASQYGTPTTDFQVVSGGGMSLTVNKGQGIFAQKWFESRTSVLFAVPNNNDLYGRIDSVIIQVDTRASGRVGNIVYRTGEASATPIPPAINVESGVYEWRVANIAVASGASSITDANITDLRGSAACPWVTGLIEQVDTSTLWAQYNTAYAEQYARLSAEFAEYESQQREAWEDFIGQLTQELTVETNVETFYSSFAATGTVTEVPIGIAAFDKDTDVLQVFVNGLFAKPEEKYAVSADGTKITLVNAIEDGDAVYFVCFKSVVNGDVESTNSLIRRLNARLSAFMADSGWINFTLEGSVTAGAVAPAYRSVGGRVFLRGSVKNVTAAGTLIAYLPVGFRPTEDHVFTSAAANGTTANDYTTVNVSAESGAVAIASVSSSLSADDEISIAACFLTNFDFFDTEESSGYMVYQGDVATYNDLPASPSVGDVYRVAAGGVIPITDEPLAEGTSFVWDGSAWKKLSPNVTNTVTPNSYKLVTSGAVQSGLDEKANSSHTHSAADITSGILGVANGGTGRSSWVSNRLIYANQTNQLFPLPNPNNFATGAYALIAHRGGYAPEAIAPPASGYSILYQGSLTAPTWLAAPSVPSLLAQDSSGAPYWTSLASLSPQIYYLGSVGDDYDDFVDAGGMKDNVIAVYHSNDQPVCPFDAGYFYYVIALNGDAEIEDIALYYCTGNDGDDSIPGMYIRVAFMLKIS